MLWLPEIVYLWTNKPRWFVFSSPCFTQLRSWQVDPPSWIVDDYRWQSTVLIDCSLRARLLCIYFCKNPLTSYDQCFAQEPREEPSLEGLSNSAGIDFVQFSVSQEFLSANSYSTRWKVWKHSFTSKNYLGSISFIDSENVGALPIPNHRSNNRSLMFHNSRSGGLGRFLLLTIL